MVFLGFTIFRWSKANFNFATQISTLAKKDQAAAKRGDFFEDKKVVFHGIYPWKMVVSWGLSMKNGGFMGLIQETWKMCVEMEVVMNNGDLMAMIMGYHGIMG